MFNTLKTTIFAPLRRLYNWTLRLAGHKHAVFALFGISFAESSFFIFPPDLILMPMCLKNRAKAFFYAAIATAGSSLGGLFGYAIGALLFETLGKVIIHFYGLESQMDAFHSIYQTHGVWIILIAGFTPIPYKLITIASGLFAFNLPLFFALSVLSRGARFFLVATLIYLFGKPVEAFLEKHFELMTVAFALLLGGGFLLLKYVF